MLRELSRIRTDPEQRSLTMFGSRGIIRNMKKKAAPISDLLRKTIAESEVPLLQIEEATGVHRACISRFVRGLHSLRLDVADRLADYFGLELRETGKRK